jgi:hypothetical protein
MVYRQIITKLSFKLLVHVISHFFDILDESLILYSLNILKKGWEPLPALDIE